MRFQGIGIYSQKNAEMNLPVASKLLNTLQAINLTFTAISSLKQIICIVIGWESLRYSQTKTTGLALYEFSTSKPFPLCPSRAVK